MNSIQLNKVITGIIFILTILSAEEKMVIRFENPDEAVINKFNNTEYDVAAFKPNVFLDLVVSKSNYEEIYHKDLQLR